MTDAPGTAGGEATITRVFDARAGLDVYLDGRPAGRRVARDDGAPDRRERASVPRHLQRGGRARALVQTFEDVENPSNQDVDVLTTTLVDLGDGKTEVTYHQVGHLPEEQYRLVEQGVYAFYDRLAEQLAR
jgi:hypothetical protein